MYFVGDDPLLIPLVCQTYLHSTVFRDYVNGSDIHIIVPKKNHPQRWIDLEGTMGPSSNNVFDGFLYLDGRAFPLPFQKRRLLQLSNVKLRETLRGYYLSKIRNSTSATTGMGGEERTYKDWVIRRYGVELYTFLFEPLIQNRYNSYASRHNISDIGEWLSAGLARDWHIPQELSWKSYQFTDGFIPPNIHIHEVGDFISLEKKKDSTWLLSSNQDDQIIPTLIECPNFAMTPQRICSLLDPSLVSTSMKVDVGYLHCQPIQKTSFLVQEIPKQFIWGIDLGVPHQMVSDSKIIQVSHQSCGEEILDQDRIRGQLNSIGIDVGPPVFYQQFDAPIWTKQSHFRFRRFADIMDKWKIKLIGNYGLFGHLRFGDQMYCLEQGLEQSNAEIIRKYVEPIVKSALDTVKVEHILYQF
jgi:hypothetical protein